VYSDVTKRVSSRASVSIASGSKESLGLAYDIMFKFRKKRRQSRPAVANRLASGRQNTKSHAADLPSHARSIDKYNINVDR